MPTSPGYRPGPLVIPLTFAMRLRWNLPNGVQASNVLHVIVPEGTTPDTALAEGVFADLKAAGAGFDNWMGYLPDSASLQGVSFRNLQVERQAEVDSTGEAAVGTSTVFPLPEEVAFVVTLRSNLTGPAHRGRLYLTGMSIDALDVLGHADTVFVDAAKGFVATIIEVVGIHGMDLGIAHRGHDAYVNDKGNNVAAEEAGTDRVLGIHITDNLFDSQRRRK